MARFKAQARMAKNGALLRIGATEFIVREYLTPIIAQVRRECPTLRIEILLGNRNQIEQWLDDRMIDLT